MMVPLGSSIKLGADEDFELSKTLLYIKGFNFYSQVWNDEPPLYPYLLAKALQCFSYSILSARLVTLAFSLALLAGLYWLLFYIRNLRTAVFASILLIAAPGFLELASSCMVEIPCIAPAVLAFAFLISCKRYVFPWAEICAGILFGLAQQMKVIAVIYLPLVVLLLWLKHRLQWRQMIISTVLLGIATLGTFVGLNLITGCSLSLQIQQAWVSHFSGVKSFEYGSPSDRVFDWHLLIKNWDATLPALLGCGILIWKIRLRSTAMFLPAWLILSFAIVSTHKPWWNSYYLHNVVPLCACAAVGFDAALIWGYKRKLRGVFTSFAVLTVGIWIGARAYLQVVAMNHAPQLDTSVLLAEINRYKPYTQYFFTLESVYTFHSGIPLPPELADISLKRLWSGDMTNAKMAAELERIKPGIILVANSSQELPYQELLQNEYGLVFQDDDHQLYALRTIIHLANP
ncbi:MAG TPA: glycosyltransferase family 39 protein [Verrucomicrobiae bacterium]|nr:glycosyltransferase family 39 protein [Verrucomicrobiae bacterium]